MEFKGLPIKGINKEEINIIVENECPIAVRNVLAYGYYGYNPRNESVSKMFYILFKDVKLSHRLPNTLKKMIKKLENQRFYKIK